jgi:hypothetical protein
MRLKLVLCAPAIAILLAAAASPSAEPVAVRYLEGLTHGFLSLKTMEGRLLGSGDLIQTVRGDRVTSRLLLHYNDGSLNDETTVFSQGKAFLVLSDHLIQKGPAFKQPIETRMDRATGRVMVRYTNDKGKVEVDDERMDLPPDLANGVMLVLSKNFRPGALPSSVSVIAFTPKPRLVKVRFATAAADPFSFAGSPRKAIHYVLRVDIGGITGLAAKVFGKQPPDSHIWVTDGEAPTFVRAQTPIATGDPPSVIELSGPVFGRRDGPK